MLDQIAAIPAAGNTSASFMEDIDAVEGIKKVSSPGGEGRIDKDSMSEEAAFRKVFEHFFAGIIDTALNADEGSAVGGDSLANDYMTKLYSQEIAESLIAEVNFKNLIAMRGFKE